MTNKLDLDLRVQLAAYHKALADKSSIRSSPQEASTRIDVILEFRGDLNDLVATGFTPRTLIEHPVEKYKIATGTVPLNRLLDLAAINHVVVLEGPQRFHPLLNYSVPEIHADVLRNGTPARKGKGVVVGIIDTGIDWRHRAFVGADDKTSRILAIWDQRLKPNTGDQTGPGGLGVEYLNDQISKALQGAATVRATDHEKGDGHGTHVAGIAAGDGSPATCCHGGGTYIGVAPEADLIVVSVRPRGDEFGEDTHLADALSYIFNHPKAAGKPVVVNISLGDNLGPHDGTSTNERAIDALVAGGSGRAVVVAAGNHASLSPDDLETLCHVKGSVTGNSQAEIEFQIREGYEQNAYLDLWYDRSATLNIEVLADGGATSGIVNHGTAHATFVANPGDSADHLINVDIAGQINGPNGRDNNFRTKISRPKKGNIPKGDWKLKLTNPAGTAANLHCWIQRGKHQPIFLPPTNPPDGKIRASSDSTLLIPATAAGAITVANHKSRTDWSDCWPKNEIHESSSRGPVARNAQANPKPDIAAPGLEITSAAADVANFIGNCCSCCPDCCCSLYVDETGTSQAAPHVTGTIALMLEANANLTKADILAHLQNSARPAPPGGTKEIWGAGKLDALAAVNRVLGIASGGGGGGPGPGPHFHDLLIDDAFTVPRAQRRSLLEGSANMFASVRTPRPSETLLEFARQRLETLPDGQHLAMSLSRHFSEVRRLINKNRRVATLWHRANGPQALRRLFHSLKCERCSSAAITDSRREYFNRWFDLLTKVGSARLRQSIERHRETILFLLTLPQESQAANLEVVEA